MIVVYYMTDRRPGASSGGFLWVEAPGDIVGVDVRHGQVVFDLAEAAAALPADVAISWGAVR